MFARVGSPTFGTWDAVEMNTEAFHAVYVAAGLGHGFVALEEDTVVSYLYTTSYTPALELAVDPLDPALALLMPPDVDLILSERDAAAPTLAQAREQGLLPEYSWCQEYASVSQGRRANAADDPRSLLRQ